MAARIILLSHQRAVWICREFVFSFGCKESIQKAYLLQNFLSVIQRNSVILHKTIRYAVFYPVIMSVWEYCTQTVIFFVRFPFFKMNAVVLGTGLRARKAKVQHRIQHISNLCYSLIKFIYVLDSYPAFFPKGPLRQLTFTYKNQGNGVGSENSESIQNYFRFHNSDFFSWSQNQKQFWVESEFFCTDSAALKTIKYILINIYLKNFYSTFPMLN